MDEIIMENMAFHGYHGVLKEEKVLGQRFYVDAKLYLDLKKAGKSDNLNDTVSYAEVYKIIEHIMTNGKFDLLEALAHKICNEILLSYENIENVVLKIKKPSAPVVGNFDYFAVKIKRSREDYE
ncbi:dihydroneopterin aldolase [Clostridium algidicarnis]|uniref:7,8-dihydroneopterin aldolase n=1 Tax=Clostridium algidicarnis TaxID=37659 RepID=A0ABS6C5K3_9CLOT|nr:dihydroneopterin aldolase [Clostridium algidicarnis]MBU3206696.1 dihydroneopterin aldolase [Clostridium algidicarnis]MBU3220774.1 dihydroneopterin aldolase [Clostridium algidicarnis]